MTKMCSTSTKTSREMPGKSARKCRKNPKKNFDTHSVLQKNLIQSTQKLQHLQAQKDPTVPIRCYRNPHKIKPKITIPIWFLYKIFPKQAKKNVNQSPTYAGKRRPLALPASGHDPLASDAVVHPHRWLVHLVSLSSSFQLSWPPSSISLSRWKKRTKGRKSGEGRKEKEERKKIEKKKKGHV